MDYDKQKPLSNKQIEYINKKYKKYNISISDIIDYPENNTHLEVDNLGIPISITRNEDEYIYGWESKNKPIKNIENCWIVYNETIPYVSTSFKVAQFKNIDDAIKYAFNEYIKQLENELAYVKKINPYNS